MWVWGHSSRIGLFFNAALAGGHGAANSRLLDACWPLLGWLDGGLARLLQGIGTLEACPARIILLDEPDHHIDVGFNALLAGLLGTLHPDHRRRLATVVVMHSQPEFAAFTALLAASDPHARVGCIRMREPVVGLEDVAVSADAVAAVRGTVDAVNAAAKTEVVARPPIIRIAEYSPA